MFLIILLLFITVISLLFIFRTKLGGKLKLIELTPEIYELEGNFLSKEEKLNIIREKLREKKYLDSVTFVDRFIEGERIHPSFLNNLFREHNQYYKVRTDYKLKSVKTDFQLPGAKLFESNINMAKARKELDNLFSNSSVTYSKIGKQNSNHFLNWYTDRHFSTVCTYSHAYSFLRKRTEKKSYISDYCENLMKEVYNLTGFKNGLLSIIRYTNMMGLGQHIDKLSLHLDGPIVTVNIGEQFFYDVFPVFDKSTNTPKRILIPKGGIFFMQGDLRNRWSHGICENDPHTEGKYSLVFKMSSFDEEIIEHKLIAGPELTKSGAD